MNLPRISIITPSYNQGNFLEETILSVINQNYPNLEYIIIDGGSTDNSIEIIKKYEKYLTYWVSEDDNGQTDAINKGFKLATGDIIAWINSDDVYCEGALNIVAQYFESNSKCQWLAGNVLFMNKEGHVYIRKYPNSSRWLERSVTMSIYQPSVFLRRSILLDIGYLREDFHIEMDLEWFCRIAQKHSIHIIDGDISKFRFHSESKTKKATEPDSNNKKLYHKEAIIILREYHSKFSWFIDRYPKTTLFLWFRIEKSMRLIERIRKKELGKLKDKIIQ